MTAAAGVAARLSLPAAAAGIVYGSMPSDVATDPDPRPLHVRLSAAPVIHDAGRAGRALADLTRRCEAEIGLAELGALIGNPHVRDLLAGIFGASPYLTALIERDPESLQRALAGNPERRFADLLAEMGAAARCRRHECRRHAHPAPLQGGGGAPYRAERHRRGVAGDDGNAPPLGGGRRGGLRGRALPVPAGPGQG